MAARLERALFALFACSGVVILVDYVALAIAHRTTLFDINQTSGAWLSFAYYLGQGVLYPPLSEGGYYAGTRYMPGFFALHAGFATITDEYLASGKLLTAASTLCIVSTLAAILFDKTRRPLFALSAAAIFLATFVGHKASLTIRGDVLPLALSLLSLAMLERSVRRSAEAPGMSLFFSSAVLAGLAPLAKFTSFHALLAGFLYLVLRDRRRAIGFAATGGAIFVAGVVAVDAVSQGGFRENMGAAAIAGSNKRDLIEALSIYFYWLKLDRGFFLLILLVPFAFARGGSLRTLELWRTYFLLHLVITIGFFLDTGAEYNHLVDLLAATIILSGELLGAENAKIRATAVSAYLLSGAIGLASYHYPAWTAPERGIVASELFGKEMGLAGKHFLTHDPAVSVLMGQRPIVADDFQFRVLVAKGVVPLHELPRRVHDKEFDRIVLLNGLEAPSSDPSYYRDREFGPFVARAIRESYELEKHVYKYYVFRPK